MTLQHAHRTTNRTRRRVHPDVPGVSACYTRADGMWTRASSSRKRFSHNRCDRVSWWFGARSLPLAISP